mmetsp:Transcript_13653/g.22535  ORF Transcript_13653/g.22535 Transcript_13653/m.22535 type:complete len:201 (-) Transcript_13653:2668-3270(-)
MAVVFLVLLSFRSILRAEPPPPSAAEPPVDPHLDFDLSVVSTQLIDYYNRQYREPASQPEPVISIITPVFRFNETKIQDTCGRGDSAAVSAELGVDTCGDSEVENAALKIFVAGLRDARVRLVRKGHMRLPGARNFAISQSRGMFYIHWTTTTSSRSRRWRCCSFRWEPTLTLLSSTATATVSGRGATGGRTGTQCRRGS